MEGLLKKGTTLTTEKMERVGSDAAMIEPIAPSLLFSRGPCVRRSMFEV